MMAFLKVFRHWLWFMWWAAKWYYITSIPIPRTVTQRTQARPLAKKLLLKSARNVWRQRLFQQVAWKILDHASKLPEEEFEELWPPERLRRHERNHKRCEEITESARRRYASLRTFLDEIKMLDPEWDADPERFLQNNPRAHHPEVEMTALSGNV
jgi:hypothetical protein